MLDEIVRGLIGGVVAEKLLGKHFRRHRYMTMAICLPLLAAVMFLAVSQILRS